MKMSTKTITISGVLAAISSVIMFMELNVPFIPGFLKIDFSDVPALLGAIAISPLVGIFVMAVKNLIHLTVTNTGGVGELANFVIGCLFILPISLIMKQRKELRFAIFAVILGVAVMTIGASLFNYYVLLPLYSKFINMEAIIEMGSKVNPNINSKLSLVLYGIAPFNVIKGLVNSIIALVILKYIPKKIIR